ncbi:hypothetical protein [Halobellus sp. Atlit-38R]|uniref:hypothetical protein n=1 Tax=Halobellus sp. Atlit-38R TaxID=2282131 RepID=UPI0011C3601E|nr:hypothetical protein [Halobellus sp. Atlit-38R]
MRTRRSASRYRRDAVVDACTLEHRGYEFYCLDRPENVPESCEGWVLHGHHHNKDLQQFPFVS